MILVNLFCISSVFGEVDLYKLVNKEKLIHYIEKNRDPSSWMMQRIRLDLSLFPPEAFARQNMALPILLSEPDHVFLEVTENNEIKARGVVFHQNFRKKVLLDVMQYFSKSFSLPKVSVLISIDDGFPKKKGTGFF